MKSTLGWKRRWTLFCALLALVCAMSSTVFAAPLGGTTPTDYWIGQGDADLSILDNSRNYGRISSVAMGDLNGDGQADLVLGAPYAYAVQSTGAPAGMVYVIYSGFNPSNNMTLDLTLRPGRGTHASVSSLAYPGGTSPTVAGYQIAGEVAGMRFGAAVACGDFNGDGVADLAVAAPRRLTSQVAGRVYLIMGDPSMRYMSDLQALRQYNRLITIVGPNRSADLSFGDHLLLFDFNGDGRDDLVIGSPAAGTGGEAHILYGGDFSGEILGADQIPASDERFVIITAPETKLGFGAALAAGDLTGDGLPDLIVGAPLADRSGADSGEVYVFSGSDPASSPPLLTRVTDPVSAATLRVVGPNANEAFGSALAVGDFDGNGFGDLAIGAPFASLSTMSSAGKLYLLYNDDPTTAQRVITPDPSQPDVAVFIGPATGSRLGSAAALGRFDDDSLADLMIGAPEIQPPGGETIRGAVFAVLGRAPAERPRGEIILNDWGGIVRADLTIWAGDSGDRLGHSLALRQFDGLRGSDLLVCGNPTSEGRAGSAWLFLGRTPTTTVILSARPSWTLYR
ncbi:FG-GAP repeat protein [Candidatus Sumerlaeota bacterium]|nr:FG-GAP repeat protein [Candidatus Sumerlaeota bacterium]